jgi:hypothetical protein
MIFLRHIKYPSTQITSSAEDPLAETLARLPAIMPRSGMGFYIIDLFEVWKFHFQFLFFILFFHLKCGSSSNYFMVVLLKTLKTSVIRFFTTPVENCLLVGSVSGFGFESNWNRRQIVDQRLQGKKFFEFLKVI